MIQKEEIGYAFREMPSLAILQFLLKMEQGELCVDEVPLSLCHLFDMSAPTKKAYARYGVFIRQELLALLVARASQSTI